MSFHDSDHALGRLSPIADRRPAPRALARTIGLCGSRDCRIERQDLASSSPPTRSSPPRSSPTALTLGSLTKLARPDDAVSASSTSLSSTPPNATSWPPLAGEVAAGRAHRNDRALDPDGAALGKRGRETSTSDRPLALLRRASFTTGEGPRRLSPTRCRDAVTVLSRPARTAMRGRSHASSSTRPSAAPARPR